MIVGGEGNIVDVLFSGQTSQGQGNNDLTACVFLSLQLLQTFYSRCDK